MKWNLQIIFAGAILARLLLVAFTAWEGESGGIPAFNDERAHLNYIRYVTQHDRLPVQTSSVQNGLEKNEYEYYQPPLYYLLARPLYWLAQKTFPEKTPQAVRFSSIVFVLAGLTILYWAVRYYFADESLAQSALLVGAFSGMMLRVGSVVSNDSLLFTLACLYFAALLAMLKEGCDARLLAAGILIAIGGLWTKISFLLLLPLLPWAILRGSAKSGWKMALAIFFPLAALAPWLWRNLHLYGSLIPVSAGFGAPDPLAAQNFSSRLHILLSYFLRSAIFPFEGYWGSSLDVIVYPFAGLTLLGLLIFGLIELRSRDRRLFAFSAAALALNSLAYVYLNYHYSQAEARYFLPAMPFILLLIALGAERLLGKRRGRAFTLLSLWIVLPWITVFF